MPAERLQKIIAAAGIASRRKAEQLITGGLVSVNGKVVTELGSKADAEHDHIRVNGKLLRGAERHVYLVMNKPKGYVTTLSDPERLQPRTIVEEILGHEVGRTYFAYVRSEPLGPREIVEERCTHAGCGYGAPISVVAAVAQ